MALVQCPAYNLRSVEELEADSSSDGSDGSDSGPETAKREWDVTLLLQQVLATPQNRVVDLSNKELRAIPDGLVSENPLHVVDVVILSYNYIRELPLRFGAPLLSVTELRLDGNELSTLPDSIRQLCRLKVLTANVNRICSLPAAIGCMKHLTTLSLEKNRLTHLPDEIGLLRNLKYLTLCDNELQSLPLSFGQMNGLTELDLTNNRLCDLPDGFGSLSRLTTLLAANNRLTGLPLSFASLPSLIRINFSSNKLKSLCSTLQSCSRLQILCLDCNPALERLPEWIFNMPNIIKLSIRSCSLTDSPLPESFGQVSRRLTELDLGANMITRLPASLSSLSELKLLNLDTETNEGLNRNRLGRLFPDFGLHLNQMRELRLNNCSLTSLPEQMGTGLCCLQLLDLSSNSLSSLPDSLCLLSQLRTLRLSHNRLRGLPDEVGKWISLTELSLAANDIVVLPISFRELAGLQMLDLTGNRVASCPGLVDGLHSLKTVIGVPENPLLIRSTGSRSRMSPYKNSAAKETCTESSSSSSCSSAGWDSSNDDSPLHRHMGNTTCFRHLRNGDFVPVFNYSHLQHVNKIVTKMSGTKRRQQLIATEAIAGQFSD